MNTISFSAVTGLIASISAFFLVTFIENRYLAGIFTINILISLALLVYINLENIQMRTFDSGRVISYMVPILDSKKRILFFCLFFLVVLITTLSIFNLSEKRNFLREKAENDSRHIIAFIDKNISRFQHKRNEIYLKLVKNGYNFKSLNSLNELESIFNIEYLTYDNVRFFRNNNRTKLDLRIFKSLVNENEKISFIEVLNGKVLFNILSADISEEGVYEYLDVVFDMTADIDSLKEIFGYDFIFISSMRENISDNPFFTTARYLNNELLYKSIEKNTSGFIMFFHKEKEYIVSRGIFEQDLFRIPSKVYFLKEVEEKYIINRFFIFEIFLGSSICIFVIIFLYTYTVKMNKIVSDAVTERDEFHSLSLEKDNNLRESLNSIEEGILITDISGFIRHVNYTVGTLTGISSDKMENRNINEFFEIESSSSSPVLTDRNDVFDDIIKKQKVILECRLREKNGDNIKISMSGSLISSDNDEAVGLIFNIKNITQSGMVKDNINTIGYEALDKTDTGFWHWNMEKGEIFFSEAWKRIIGVDKEVANEIEEMFSRIHPNEKEKVFVDLYEHINGETDLYYSEHRMKRDNETYIWVCDRGRVVERNETGEAKRLICATSGINLRKNEEFFLNHRKKFFLSGPVIYFRWKNIDGLPVECVSSNVKDLLGYSENDFINGLINYRDILDEKDYSVFSRSFNSSENYPGSSIDKVFSIYTGDGRKKRFLHHINVIRDDSDNASHFIGYVISEN